MKPLKKSIISLLIILLLQFSVLVATTPCAGASGNVVASTGELAPAFSVLSDSEIDNNIETQYPEVDIVRLFWHESSGLPELLMGEAATASALGLSVTETQEPQYLALAFLQSYQASLDIEAGAGQWDVASSVIDDLGISHVRLQQYYNGLSVFAAELMTHISRGRIIAMNGVYPTSIQLSIQPELDTIEAYQIVAQEMDFNEPVLEGNELVIFNPAILDNRTDSENHLAYMLIIYEEDPPGSQTVFIDAHDGQVLYNYSNWPTARNRSIHDLDGSTSLPGPLSYVESGPIGTPSADATNAYNFTGDTYDYYFNTFTCDSFDNLGATLQASVRYGTVANAFWTGAQTAYGPGFAEKDVVAHEWTHAVNQYTADLIYSYQSGALNEAMSDIFACMIDRDDWEMGEDTPIGIIRSLSNPAAYEAPGKVSEYVVTSSDYGGVHINCSIPAHAAYLMAEGGTYNGRTITGIGREYTEQTFYRALTTYLTSGSGFNTAYNAIRSACSDLYGINSDTYNNVTAALQAVELDQPVPGSGSTPPVAVSDAYSVLKDNLLTVSAPGVLANDTDADGDPLTAALNTGVSHGSLILNGDGSFTYTPEAEYIGGDSFTYLASDGDYSSNIATVSITIKTSGVTFGLNNGDVSWDDSPNYLSAVRFRNTAGTGTLTELGILFDDTSPTGMARLGVYADNSGVPGGLLLDAGQVAVTNGWVSISGLSLPVTQDVYYWLAYSLGSTNRIRYQRGQAANSNRWISFTYGTFPIQFKSGSSSDNNQTVMRANVAIGENEPPVAVNDSHSVDEDTTLTVAVPGILGNDSDGDGDSLTAVLVTGVSHGNLTLGGDGSFTYAPDADYAGTDSFTYQANDGWASSNVATVAITVTAINDLPVANDQAVSTDEDTPVAITLTASDVDGDPLTYEIASSPEHGNLSGTAPDLTYTPESGYIGSTNFTFKANDGQVDSNTATVTINVTPLNHAPVADDQAVNTPEDTDILISLTASDADGDPLTYEIVSSPSHGSLEDTVPDVTYNPDTNYNGADSFTFKVDDGKADSNIATVSITVTAVNDPPVADEQAVSTGEDTPVAITLAVSDVDGDILSFEVVTGPGHGTLSGTAPNLAYTPVSGYVGPDSFTFKANDGVVDSNIATVTITITGSSTSATFGLNKGDVSWNDSPNYLSAVRLRNTTGTGTLTELGMLFDDTSPTGMARLGVYADSSGVPGGLLLDAGQVAVTNGWVSISGLSLSVTQDAYYWLAYSLGSPNRIRYQRGQAANSNRWISFTYGTFPIQFKSGSSSDNNQTVMRATVVIGAP